MKHKLFESARSVPKSIAAQLKYLGSAKNKTVTKQDRAFADLLGVSDRTVRAWRNGERTPSKRVQARIDEAIADKRDRGTRRTAKKFRDTFGDAAGAGIDIPAGGAMVMEFSGQLDIEDSPGRHGRARTIHRGMNYDQAERYAAAVAAGDDTALVRLARELLGSYFQQGGGAHQVQTDDIRFSEDDITWR